MWIDMYSSFIGPREYIERRFFNRQVFKYVGRHFFKWTKTIVTTLNVVNNEKEKSKRKRMVSKVRA
jgi:hypothetical protein